MLERVAIIGSGNWGSAIASVVGQNVRKAHLASLFHPRVPLWVRPEQVDGEDLGEIINRTHENKKYLPGHTLPDNIFAEPDLRTAARDATLLIFVVPHQFLGSVLEELKGHVRPDARALTLIKGMAFTPADQTQGGQPTIALFPRIIHSALGLSTSALSGANIANEVAGGQFSETTIGYAERSDGLIWKHLVQTPAFHVQLSPDVLGVSLCGALKNVVAIAAGFVDGMQMGSNSKAAIIRIGLNEMRAFALAFFPGAKHETFSQESCGIADLITTCLGGRNRRCAEAFAKGGKTMDEIEEELLNGQKLAGTGTAKELYQFLVAREAQDDYPLFVTTYRIIFEGLPVSSIFDELTKNRKAEQKQEVQSLLENRESR